MNRLRIMSSITMAGLAVLAMTIAFSAMPLSSDTKTASDQPDFGPLLQEAQAAGSNKFLHVSGIKGESSDNRHLNDIVVESFAWGVSRPFDPTGGGVTGDAAFTEFTVTKAIDRASPRVFLKAAEGEEIPRVELFVYRGNDDTPYLTVEFRDVLITEITQSSVGESDLESMSFGYGSIKFTYREQLSNGNYAPPVSGGWDVFEGKKR